nr:hypothetical protein [Rhodococcus sp. P1Y]
MKRVAVRSGRATAVGELGAAEVELAGDAGGDPAARVEDVGGGVGDGVPMGTLVPWVSVAGVEWWGFRRWLVEGVARVVGMFRRRGRGGVGGCVVEVESGVEHGVGHGGDEFDEGDGFGVEDVGEVVGVFVAAGAVRRMVAPMVRGQKISGTETSNPMLVFWRTRSPSVRGKTVWRQVMRLMIAWWEIMTPLGRPVVPEVKMTYAVSAGVSVESASVVSGVGDWCSAVVVTTVLPSSALWWRVWRSMVVMTAMGRVSGGWGVMRLVEWSRWNGQAGSRGWDQTGQRWEWMDQDGMDNGVPGGA